MLTNPTKSGSAGKLVTPHRIRPGSKDCQRKTVTCKFCATKRVCILPYSLRLSPNVTDTGWNGVFSGVAVAMTACPLATGNGVVGRAGAPPG